MGTSFTSTVRGAVEALAFFTTRGAGYVSGCAVQQTWPNLHFAPSGLSRLCHMVGVIGALEALGQRPSAIELLAATGFPKGSSTNPHWLALRIAGELKAELDFLNGYGTLQTVEPAPGVSLTVPSYRVVISDDGTFGSFSLLWYLYLSHARWNSAAEEASIGGSVDWGQVEQKLKVNPDLTVHKYYDVPGEARSRVHTCRYAFSHNGGLILHGWPADPSYSIHT